jgi:hypothetical protein
MSWRILTRASGSLYCMAESQVLTILNTQCIVLVKIIYRRIREWCIDTHFLEVGFTWRWVVSFKIRSPYLWKKRTSGIHWIGGQVGPRYVLVDTEKIVDPIGNPKPTPRSSSTLVSLYTNWATAARLIGAGNEFLRAWLLRNITSTFRNVNMSYMQYSYVTVDKTIS